MFSWMMNPLFFGVAFLAVLSPIIIHLLNRRRFKIVDWAAIRFLLDADKKNRKRVRLENLILLLLRCLAMFLLGFLISRPFLPSALGNLLGNEPRYERVIVLDDSLSQQVITENRTQFERSVESLKDLINQISRDDKEDFLTLYVTSRPDKAVLANEPVTPETVVALTQTIEELECSDSQAYYSEVLQEVQRYASGNQGEISRLIYVMSDLRTIDWATPKILASDSAPNKILSAIAEDVAQTSVVDTGTDVESNLAILDIRPQDMLVANTIVRFNVTVANYGDKVAKNVQVRFHEGDNPSQTETIANLAPGKNEVVTFRYLFQYDLPEFDDLDLQEKLQANLLNYRVSAELIHDGSTLDYLPADSSHFHAARVLQGIPVLVVDGEPSPNPERSESYFLRRIGVGSTGLLVDTVTVAELEDVSLSKYKVIFLCNVDEASADRVKALEQWVANEGGLVFMPGGVCSANRFNASFYQDGNGLSPLKLIAEAGDPTQSQWINFEIENRNHPSLRVALDQDVDLGKVEIFSWWDTEVHPDQIDKTVSVPLRLSNDLNSPAMAERTFENGGKVVTFAIPADGDWTIWPVHPTYLCVMWDMVNYLSGSKNTGGNIRVGNSIEYPVDLSRYDLKVGLSDPSQEKVEVTAVPIDDNTESKQSVMYKVSFDEMNKHGFYEMNLRRQNGEDDKVLFAANVDSFESDLKRINVSALGGDFFGEETRLISTDELSGKVDSRSSSEMWPKILIALLGVLAIEQFLGWLFGRSR